MHIKFSKITACSMQSAGRGMIGFALVFACVFCYQPVFAQGTASFKVPAAVGSLPQTESITSIPNYKITASDLLEIEVFGVEDLKRTVRVNTTGSISIPLVGMVQVAGLTVTEAEAVIAMRYGADYLQNPQVSIFIKEFTTQRVTIDGAVNKPGIYPLTGQITLLRALALAGGGAQLANLEDVLLFRSNGPGPQEVFKYDVKKIRNGELEDPILKGDDLVVVNRSGSRELLKDSVLRDVLDFINPFSILSK
jgi:polysaccharide biosynthesis/export protein